MKFFVLIICMIGAVLIIAWEDHPDREHGFNPDKCLNSSGNNNDHWKNDDSGKNDNSRENYRENEQGTYCKPDRDK